MNDLLVSVRNLTVSFTNDRTKAVTDAVRGISFDLHAGRTLAMVGESGSGKSVSSRALLGLVGQGSRVQADRFEILGENAAGFSDAQWRQIRGRQIGMVLQDALVSLDPLRRVGAELTEPLKIHTSMSAPEREKRALDLLSAVGIPDPKVRYRQYPHELSGGLRQRALIASAVALKPQILIADEPTTALDTTIQAQVIELLREMKQGGDAMVFISHDLAVVSSIADDIIVMKDGLVVESGSAEQVLQDPQEEYTKRLLRSNPAGRPKGMRLSQPLGNEDAPARVRDREAPVPAAPPGNVFEVANLVKTYSSGGSERRAVDDVSFTLGRGETLGIVGESGSGKTTVARIVLGLVRPDSGTVELEGGPWSVLTERGRRPRRDRMQMIAQDPFGSFDPRYAVRAIIAEAVPDRKKLGKAATTRTVVDLLDRVGLSGAVLDRRPIELSGGQRQRVAIARALAPGSPVLVCDEPVTALDVTIQAQVLDLLSDLQEDLGLSMLFISHDLGVIRHMSDRMLVMKDGKVVEAGATEEVFSSPAQAYTRALLASLPQEIA